MQQADIIDGAATVICNELGVDLNHSHNVVQLFNDDNTIPFIARYRREKTGGMDANVLRQALHLINEFKQVKSRAETISNQLLKLGKLTPVLRHSVACATSISDLEAIYAPYKPGSKGTLAERARELGLSDVASQVIAGTIGVAHLNGYVDARKTGLKNVTEVQRGIQHIIVDNLFHNERTQKFLLNLLTETGFFIDCSRIISKKKEEEPDKVNVNKFSDYFDFSRPLTTVKPHQILAINRGEGLKVLKVKLRVHESFGRKFSSFSEKALLTHKNSHLVQLIQSSILDCYQRFAEPWLLRRKRSEINRQAELAAIEVFASNLKQLLLTPPVKDKIIMGVDPGFAHGCKYASISKNGDLQDSGVFYLPNMDGSKKYDGAVKSAKFVDSLLRNSCDLIAIGNGTACRETEQFVSHVIKTNNRLSSLKYCIVNECGASIYSTSSVADEEFKNLDVNLRSAASIARRLQDPLAEYVKIAPEHLGVGMYQHDCKQKSLKESLDSIVEECVSFVGVDINTASKHLLARVAGIRPKTADNIIEFRQKNQKIYSRNSLLSVKGVGQKTFEQFAGFVRIYRDNASSIQMQGTSKRKLEETSSDVPAKKKSKNLKKKPESNSNEFNILDSTSIHPESYGAVGKTLAILDIEENDIGRPNIIIDKFKKYTLGNTGLASKIGTSVVLLEHIFEELKKPINFDLRQDFDLPLFRSAVTSIESIKSGQLVTGCVRNVTHFGAFVDIGVGIDGLLHVSQFRNDTFQIGQRVDLKVKEVDVQRKRISLWRC